MSEWQPIIDVDLGMSALVLMVFVVGMAVGHLLSPR